MTFSEAHRQGFSTGIPVSTSRSSLNGEKILFCVLFDQTKRRRRGGERSGQTQKREEETEAEGEEEEEREEEGRCVMLITSCAITSMCDKLGMSWGCLYMYMI